MKTCLVVDDSSVIRKVARRILEGLDFKIIEAEDGQQALEHCRTALPDAELPIAHWRREEVARAQPIACSANVGETKFLIQPDGRSVMRLHLKCHPAPAYVLGQLDRR